MTNWRIFYVLAWWLQSRVCATSRPRHVSKDSDCCSFYYPLRLRLHLLHSNQVGSVPLPSAFISHVDLGSMSLCSRSSPARALHSSSPFRSARPRQAPASTTLLSAFNLPLQALAPGPLLSFGRLEGQAAPLRLRLGPVSASAPWPAPGLRSVIATPPRTTSSLGSCSATNNFSQRHAIDSTSFSPGRLQDLRPRRPRASAFALASGIGSRIGLASVRSRLGLPVGPSRRLSFLASASQLASRVDLASARGLASVRVSLGLPPRRRPPRVGLGLMRRPRPPVREKGATQRTP